jgi:3-oxoacyl-[acyl-carrier protein] reductase
MSLLIDLRGKVALITGSSQGIGAAICTTLHRAGATVILNHPGIGSCEEDAASIAATLNNERSGSASVQCADVSDAVRVQAMMESIQREHGGLDFLVNNAGILRDRTISKMTLDEWNAVLDVNLSGVFHSIKYGMPVMRDGGAIVSLGSIAAFLGFFGQANYAAAKAGVLAMTRVASREFAKKGIRVNAVAPGVFDTDMWARNKAIPGVVEMVEAQTPLRRWSTAEDVADVVVFLASDAARYVTGETLCADGGMARTLDLYAGPV